MTEAREATTQERKYGRTAGLMGKKKSQAYKRQLEVIGRHPALGHGVNESWKHGWGVHFSEEMTDAGHGTGCQVKPSSCS